MSQAIWVNSLIGEEIRSDESDKPDMLRFADRLDRLCRGPKLSAFFDDTEAQAIVADDYQGFDDGWELVKHQGQWFAPADGLAVLTELVATIERDQPRIGTLADRSGEVLAELKECIAELERIAASGGRFHFAVVA